MYYCVICERDSLDKEITPKVKRNGMWMCSDCAKAREVTPIGKYTLMKNNKHHLWILGYCIMAIGISYLCVTALV